MRPTSHTIIFFLAAYFASALTYAQEANITGHSTVSGNQEQPRVMYIVPWQRPQAAEFGYELENELAQELFGVVDREEFVREMNYRDQLTEQLGEEPIVENE